MWTLYPQREPLCFDLFHQMVLRFEYWFEQWNMEEVNDLEQSAKQEIVNDKNVQAKIKYTT